MFFWKLAYVLSWQIFWLGFAVFCIATMYRREQRWKKEGRGPKTW